MAKHDHNPPQTSDSPRSGYGGKHSAGGATTPRTDAGKLLGGGKK